MILVINMLLKKLIKNLPDEKKNIEVKSVKTNDDNSFQSESDDDSDAEFVNIKPNVSVP